MLKLIVLLFMASFCDCYKILVVFPLAGKSHAILGDGVVEALVKAGHEVTYVSAFPKKDSPNLHYVDVSMNMDLLKDKKVLDIKAIMNKEIDFKDRNFLDYFMRVMSNMTMTNENVLNFLKDPKQDFDVIITEWMFSELYSVFQAFYHCPLIWFSTIEPHWTVLKLIDDLPNPAFTSDYMSDNQIPPFSFLQRVEELWVQISRSFIGRYFTAMEEETYQNVIVPILKQRGKPVPDYEELRFNISLMLGNSHVSMGQAMTLPQSYKNVGGYHIDREVKPLPKDLKKLMDDAKDGVIYFSMGSNLRSKDLPDELKSGFLKVLGGLKQTVLWKFEEKLPNLPKNVHILEWAPQPSILSHPNCLLFITHGGLLSTTETIHYGVPILGIPVFADQFMNVNLAVAKGFAKKVELSMTMVDEFESAIKDMISNPEYKKKVKELSFIYHDRPVPPAQEMVHWVEHVIKTGGAPHLRSPALLVPLYQKVYLDLIALVLILLVVLIIGLKKIWSVIFSSKKVSNSKKKN